MLALFLATALSACGMPAADAEANDRASGQANQANGDTAALIYELDYRVTPDPRARGAHVELTVTQPEDYLREMSMPTRDGQISEISGDGDVATEGDRVVWSVPAEGGTLRWFARIDRQRGSSQRHDAWMEADWAIFRGMTIIPSADSRVVRGAESRTTLAFDLPEGWSSATPYHGQDDRYEIVNPERRFVTPTGWMVLGQIGVRTETIANVRTKVAGPAGHSVRRMDMLALLQWTLPEAVRLMRDFPERLTIVSAGEPMWRGALSGPQSIYVHAERPLISENGTSTLLHELVHVGMRVSAAADSGADWIVEGFATYYSLELLRRSGTISEERYRASHAGLANRGRQVRNLCTRQSAGSNTARAVAILAELNGEMERRSGGRASLDDVLRELSGSRQRITVQHLRDIVARIIGRQADALRARNLPGCS